MPPGSANTVTALKSGAGENSESKFLIRPEAARVDIEKDSNAEQDDTLSRTEVVVNQESAKVREYIAGTSRDIFAGQMGIPVAVVGPVKINGKSYEIPVATRDLELVRNINRAAEALCTGNGVTASTFLADSMYTGSIVRFSSEKQASRALLCLNQRKNFELMKAAYENVCPATILCRIHGYASGQFLYMRLTLRHKKDDSMEIRNVTKGNGMEVVLGLMKQIFDDMKIVSCANDLSRSQDSSSTPTLSNKCKLTMEQLGGSVVAHGIVSAQLIRNILKCRGVGDLVAAQKLKNLIDSSATGFNTGFSSSAANIASAACIAMGKDPIQTVLRSSCVTSIKPCGPKLQDLHIESTFPSFYFTNNLNSTNTNLPQLSSDRETATIICSLILVAELARISDLVDAI